MEAKVNFTLVGLFVLVLAVGLIGGVLWFGSDKQFGKQYETYLVYEDESVSGLNLNAPVKYRGVDVGSVGKIELDADDSERVRLSLNIELGTPVKEDTVAVLRTQGLTGIAYVDLMGGARTRRS
jgi:ABC-type transport system involved in resistance to organic solvents, periplasmic component